MTRGQSTESKKIEILKYYDLINATLEYLIDNAKIKTEDFDSDQHYKLLKEQASEHLLKGRLSILKQWFRDLTEMQREIGDLNFNTYLKNKTGHEINIFKDYLERIDNIILKEKITTNNQFNDIKSMIDFLSQASPMDSAKIDKLNKLVSYYEQRKMKKA